MGNVFLREESLVVLLFVESHNSLDVELLEYFYIFAWMMPVSLVSISLLDGSHESHELAWNNPVEVSVLDPLVLLVLLDVEGLVDIPFEFDCVLQTLQALQESTLIETVTFGGVSIAFKK